MRTWCRHQLGRRGRSALARGAWHGRGFAGTLLRVKFASLLTLLFVGCNVHSSVSSVYLALDGEGNRRRTTFHTDSTEVNCIAEVASGRSDETIEIYIRQLKDSTNAKTDRVVAYAEAASTPSENPTRYVVRLVGTDATGKPQAEAPIPSGVFTCEVRIDGAKDAEAQFVVAFPECPDLAIAPGSICAGFYPDGKSCKANGRTSTSGGTCTCQGGKWGC